jgi:hypothetical protein
MLFHTSELSLASGESTSPESAAKRAERTPGAPVEGVHFEAGVVGQHQLAGSKQGVVDSLEGGVGGEGGAGLIGSGDGGRGGKEIDGDGMGLSGGAKIAQLALAGGGGEEAEGHRASLACGAQARQRVSEPAGWWRRSWGEIAGGKRL